MSTALRTHRLLDGPVVSDESDNGAFYRHAGKLDKLSAAAAGARLNFSVEM